MNGKVTALAVLWGLLSPVCFAQSAGVVAICPWTFVNGNPTSRPVVVDTIRTILEKHDYTVLPQHDMEARYHGMNPAIGMRGEWPIPEDLSRYGNAVGASHVIYGRTRWDTRSIWVGTGPKTISTAKVDIFIYNTKTGQLVYSRRGVQGRSDERENAIKDVLDVLVTPLITVVSGGPATPREQRAAQIATARALRPWVWRRDHAQR